MSIALAAVVTTVACGTLLFAIKPGPRLAVAGLFLICSAAQRKGGAVATVTLALAGSIAAFTGAAVVGYGIAVGSAPSVTPDGHGVMPVGQALIGVTSGTGVAVWTLVAYIRRWRHDPVSLRTLQYALHGVTATAAVAALTLVSSALS